MLKEICATEAGQFVAKQAQENGKQLILTSYGELLEGMIGAFKGGLTWWQVLQIPVELGVKMLFEADWFKKMVKEELGVDVTKDGAYAASKLASILTSAGVGVAVGGVAGVIGAVALWFTAEIFTFGIRMLAGWVSSFFTKDGSDYFDQYIGPSRTMSLLKTVLGNDPQTAIMNFMINYMKSTQQKKVA